MFDLSMEERERYTLGEISDLIKNPVVCPIAENLVFAVQETGVCGLVTGEAGAFVDVDGTDLEFPASTELRVVHPFDLYQSGDWTKWQKLFYKKQQEESVIQPLRQIRRSRFHICWSR